MIEHAGVNIYDLQNLPKAVQDSKYEWVIEFKTNSKRLVNTLSSGI
jgi:hypothetical protein